MEDHEKHLSTDMKSTVTRATLLQTVDFLITVAYASQTMATLEEDTRGDDQEQYGREEPNKESCEMQRLHSTHSLSNTTDHLCEVLPGKMKMNLPSPSVNL